MVSAADAELAVATGMPTANPIVKAATPTAASASPIFPPRVRYQGVLLQLAGAMSLHFWQSNKGTVGLTCIGSLDMR